MKAPTLPLLLNTWVQIPSISCLNYAVASYLEVLSRVVFYKMQFLSCHFSVRNPPASLHPEPKLSQYPTWSVALRPRLLLCSPLLCCAVLIHFSCVWLFATAWTVAPPTPRLLCPWGFYSQEYWSGLPCLPPGDLPNPVIEPRSSALQVDSLPPSHQGSPRKLEWVAYRFSRGSSQLRNWGLPNCRQILYQLSYQGGPSSAALFIYTSSATGLLLKTEKLHKCRESVSVFSVNAATPVKEAST